MPLIALNKLVPNQNWQTRHKLDEENVARLMAAMKSKAKLPKILVRRIPGTDKYEIFDGFHRHEAAKRLGRKTLSADIFKGDEHAAMAAGVERNMQHGLQLIKADMKRAAQMLYKPGASGGGNNRTVQLGSVRWVAELLGVGRGTVHSWVTGSSYQRDRARVNAGKLKRYDELTEEGIKEAVAEEFGMDALSAKYEPTVKWSYRKGKPGSPGTPVLMISDVHYGEVVNAEEIWNSNAFSRAICKRRLEHTFTTAVGLLNKHMANPDFPGIVLVLAGDLISGELHDEHMSTDEVGPIRQAMEVAEIISDGVAFLASEFKKVSVYCVAGNHGRTTRKPRTKFYAEYNLDWLAYKMIERHTGPLKNVDVQAPNARDLNFDVAGHRYRLTHGDQFRGGDGIIGPLGPIIRGDVRKRVTASLMPGAPEAYDTLLCGHFHQLLMLPRLIVNGSVKGYDEYALSINVPWEPPQQALWCVHPQYGQTWYMPVLCDENYQAHKVGEVK